MLLLEYNSNKYPLPSVGLTIVKLSIEKHKSTFFDWSDAIGDRVKENVVVFKHSKVKDLLCCKETINNVLQEQKVTSTIDR